jgi:membrane protein CcdC involved in cytochrome C biogenesis
VTFADKDAVVAQLFDALGALMYVVDVFDTAVNTVKTKAHRSLP